MSVRITVALAAVCTLCQPALAKPTIQTIDVPNENATTIVAINDVGVAAGYATDTTGVYHGFVRTASGRFTVFDPPGSMGTLVNGIDTTGDIVGWFYTATGGECFIRSAAGGFTLFQATHASIICDATAINSKGDVAGYQSTERSEYGFLRVPSGQIKQFLKLSSGTSTVNGINDSLDIVGSAPDESGLAGFLRLGGGTIATFHAPGDANGTYADSINNKKTIAGYFIDSSHNGHGFIRSADSTLTEFDVSGANSTRAFAINSKSEVTGSYQMGNTDGGYVREPNGQITTFLPNGALITFPLSVNKSGIVAGGYEDQNDITHGFIRTP